MTRPSALPRLTLALLLLGLGLRAGFALYLKEKSYQPDEGVYITLARDLRAYGVYGEGGVPTADKPPVVSLGLAAVFSAFGERLWIARLLNAVLSILSAWLLFEYGTLLFGSAVGAIAAGIAAVYPFFIYWSGILMSETAAIFFVVSALYLTQRVLESKGRPAEAWLAGLCWGLAVLTRAQNLWCWAALLAWIVFDRVRRREAFPFLGFTLPVLLLAGLWMGRNHRVVGAWTMDTHSGYTMIIRTMFYDEDNIDTGVAAAALAKKDFYPEAMALPVAARDKFFFRKAVEYAREHPALYLRHCAGNFVQFWRFYPRVDKTVGVTPGTFLFLSRNLFVALALLTEPWLILLGLAGLYFALKEKKAVALPALYILCNAAIHSLVISQMRYRMPVMPLVILFAAFGAHHLMRSFQRRHG
jgi:4-amino-4-deoxy-L-arabinose transferase-like glycosyltransferase